MNNQDMTQQEIEIKSAIMDRIEDSIDGYFQSFHTKAADGKGLPNINDIESIVSDLRQETRNIYLSMIEDTISNFDESELIDSKKVNTD